MAFDKTWNAVPPQNFTADGGPQGQVAVADTAGFYLGQSVLIRSNTIPAIQLEVKSVAYPFNLVLGPKLVPGQLSDLSAYLTSESATIEAREQIRPDIPWQTIYRSVYEEAPLNAIRTTIIGPNGSPVTKAHPFPVSIAGTTIDFNGDVYVKLTDKPNIPESGDEPDAVQIGDGTNRLKVNPDGSITVIVENASSTDVVISQFDAISSIASGILSTISTYTVPFGKKFQLSQIELSGDNIATYEVSKNSSIIARKRTYFGGGLNERCSFLGDSDKGLAFVAGDVLTVSVTHNRPAMGSFESRIVGTESVA